VEVQLLNFLKPPVKPEGDIGRLDRIGFNHICFAVSDIDALIAKVTAAGVRLRNQPMSFHDRKLVFLEGPEGITVELAEWR
jgi:catechol 2,3-dioxygenase-like lactoylglutathione lyase family enzyme